jgi:hypothetical protein
VPIGPRWPPPRAAGSERANQDGVGEAASAAAGASWSPARVTGVLASVHLIYLIAAVPLAIAVLIAAVVWRGATRERAGRSLRHRLESTDPEARKATLDYVNDEVLANYAGVLLALLERETDPDVLDALAAAIARSKWEPTDDPDLVALRRWVAGSQARPTSSSPQPVATGLGDAGTPVASTNGRHKGASTAPGGDDKEMAPVASSDAEVGGLVDRVREVLGDVERVELVSIDGQLLTSWSVTDRAGGRSPGDDAYAP